MKAKVLLAWKASPNEVKIFEELLGDLADIDYLTERGGLAEKIKDADIVVGGHIGDELIERATKLKFIQSVAAGVDMFNFGLLKNRNIMLASAKGCNAREVAEHAFALLLALAKKITGMDSSLKGGKWIPWREETMLDDLSGKTLGIVGYGHIGRELARMAKCFGMRVLAVKRTPPREPRDRYADYIGGVGSLDEVLQESDFVVVALPLTPETRGMINADRLRRMKRTAYLINMGRGPVVDEEALYTALVEGWIAGAGIDVWYEYPPSPNAPSRLGIHRLGNVVASSHKGGWTPGARAKCIRFAAENVRRFILGETPLNLVDPDVPY